MALHQGPQLPRLSLPLAPRRAGEDHLAARYGVADQPLTADRALSLAAKPEKASSRLRSSNRPMERSEGVIHILEFVMNMLTNAQAIRGGAEL
jgi:hypothetical protein